jgi:hypothetical protein
MAQHAERLLAIGRNVQVNRYLAAGQRVPDKHYVAGVVLHEKDFDWFQA